MAGFGNGYGLSLFPKDVSMKMFLCDILLLVFYCHEFFNASLASNKRRMNAS